MDGLEKIKIYAQMLLEVINEEEKGSTKKRKMPLPKRSDKC